MSIKLPYENITHVIQFDSDTVNNCKNCSYSPKVEDDLSDLINHYMKKHSYKLLHIGSEYRGSDRGTRTVVFMGN